jgi:hypothetical protein
MKKNFIKLTLPLFVLFSLTASCEKEKTKPHCETVELAFNNALDYKITVEVVGEGRKDVSPYYGVGFHVKPNRNYQYTIYRTSNGKKVDGGTVHANGCGENSIYDVH